MLPRKTLLAAALALALPALGVATALQAQTSPQAPVYATSTTPYPGTITLDVDATNLSQRVFQVKERMPVQAGPLTLLFPKWLPGNHADYGRVDKVAGLVITANGKRLEWVRDPLDVFAFKVDVPQGATNLDIEFQFLTPTGGDQGRVVMPSSAPIVTTPVPPTPVIRMFQGWSRFGSVGAGRFARRSADPVPFFFFSAPPCTVTKLGQKPLTQL